MSDEAAEATEVAPTPLASYASDAPNFAFGRWTFTPTGSVGQLDLFDADEVAEFEEELAGLAKRAPAVRGRIRKVSIEAAEEMARKYLEEMAPAARNGVVDSSVIKQAEVIAADQQKPTPFVAPPGVALLGK